MTAPDRRETLILTRSEVASLLDLATCAAAVEEAFGQHGRGESPTPGVIGTHVSDGGFHIKAGLMLGDTPYFAAKSNANFMGNMAAFGLPTIQGVIVLHDAANGYPVAVMDSIEISIQRTGAATAVAAKYLARPDSSVAAIAGCGAQGRVQLHALKTVLPIQKAYVWDLDGNRATQLAGSLADELAIDIQTVDEYAEATRLADVCVTCTPSHEFILRVGEVRPGCFIAGVGVDNPHKKELDPRLLAESKVVVDVLDQCATIGDLHHAIEAGLVHRDDVHAELGSIVAGRKPGREPADDSIVFDSTGMALQDVAAARLVYRRATESGIGTRVDFQS